MDWNGVLSGLNIPGLSSINDLLTWAVAIGSVIGLAVIAYAGVRYTASAGNSSIKEDAKDRITKAVYGLLLLLVAYILLYLINPEILGH